MNNYPTKITMDFGEELEIKNKNLIESENCIRTYCKFWNSNMEQYCSFSDPEKCAIPIKKSITFELTKDCEECGGDGELWDDDYESEISCYCCEDNGLKPGKVQRYWTPEEAKEHIKKEIGVEIAIDQVKEKLSIWKHE